MVIRVYATKQYFRNLLTTLPDNDFTIFKVFEALTTEGVDEDAQVLNLVWDRGKVQ